MLYRVLRPLSTGHKQGDLVEGSRFKSLDVLVKVRALAEAKAPPLSEIPEWGTRSEKLITIGIVTIQDFLSADMEQVAELFNHKRVSTSKKWQKDVEQWLYIEPKKKK